MDSLTSTFFYGTENTHLKTFHFFEVRISTHRFNVLCYVFHATSAIDPFFRADAGPSSGTKCALSPLSVSVIVS